MCHRKESGFWGSESNLKLGRFNMLFPYLSSRTGCLSGPEAVNGAGRLLWWCTCLVRPWQHCPPHSSITITPPPPPLLPCIILRTDTPERSWQCHMTPTNVFHMFSLVFPTVMNNFKSQQANLLWLCNFCTVQKCNEDHQRDTQGALREDSRKRLLGRPTESGQSSFIHMRQCMITSLEAGPGCVEGGLK